MNEPVPEMVDRVARAISGAPFPSPASYRKARAAIRAMREPTDGMVRAAHVECHRMCGVIDPVMHVWDVMLDAAFSCPAPAEEP